MEDREKLQTPNTKLQAPEKLQTPNSKHEEDWREPEAADRKL